jgi:predicted TIM-barrel fold metal-dependent hydrolase
MIIDIHTHTPTHRGAVPKSEEQWNAVGRPDKAVKVTVSWQEYAQAAAGAGVDVSVVFTIAVAPPGTDSGISYDYSRVNDSTAEFVAADPGRRIGFMSVHPDDPRAMEEIDRCVTDLGLQGIKLGPNYQNFDPLGDNARLVYAEAERRGLPIVFHQGASPVQDAPLRYAHPLTIDEVAIGYPELRIVMAHMGHPWQADTIVTIRKHPNVYADISALFYRPWSFYAGMRLATEWNVLPKLLFGSDYPIIAPGETIEGLRRVNDVAVGAVLPLVPLEAIEEIIHRDSLALLGLSAPTGTPQSSDNVIA